MYEPPKPGSKIIIVDAGCFGLATALALSLDKEKNYDVDVYDKGLIPINDAASTGKLRNNIFCGIVGCFF
jgi:sarcosine oxidase/L-pipecolate oxidase